MVRGEDRKLVRRSCLVAGLEKQVIWGESCLGHGGCIHSQVMEWASEHPPGHSYPARLSSWAAIVELMIAPNGSSAKRLWRRTARYFLASTQRHSVPVPRSPGEASGGSRAGRIAA